MPKKAYTQSRRVPKIAPTFHARRGSSKTVRYTSKQLTRDYSRVLHCSKCRYFWKSLLLQLFSLSFLLSRTHLPFPYSRLLLKVFIYKIIIKWLFVVVATYLQNHWIQPGKWHLGRKRGYSWLYLTGFDHGPMFLGSCIERKSNGFLVAVCKTWLCSLAERLICCKYFYSLMPRSPWWSTGGWLV